MINDIQQGNVDFNYLEEYDIYYFDYTGIISIEKGLSNMDKIKDKLLELSVNRTCLRILFDLSNTIWESRETHDALSKIARTIFNPTCFDCVIYTAILNTEIEGITFENERWFLTKNDAIKWLVEKI